MSFRIVFSVHCSELPPGVFRNLQNTKFSWGCAPNPLGEWIFSLRYMLGNYFTINQPKLAINSCLPKCSELPPGVLRNLQNTKFSWGCAPNPLGEWILDLRSTGPIESLP